MVLQKLLQKIFVAYFINRQGFPASFYAHHASFRKLIRLFPGFQAIYDSLGWKTFPTIDRICVNEQARKVLEWKTKYDFLYILDLLKKGEEPGSELSMIVGNKGYHRKK